jgi:hypothetical protein
MIPHTFRLLQSYLRSRDNVSTICLEKVFRPGHLRKLGLEGIVMGFLGSMKLIKEMGHLGPLA